MSRQQLPGETIAEILVVRNKGVRKIRCPQARGSKHLFDSDIISKMSPSLVSTVPPSLSAIYNCHSGASPMNKPLQESDYIAVTEG